MQIYQTCFNALFLMLALTTLFGCQSNLTSTQSEEKNTNMDQLFDFTQYASRDDAQAAFDQAFPIGSDVAKLLEYAEKHFDTKDSRKVRDTYFKEPTNVDSYLFSKTYQISSENQNLWILGLMVDQSGKIAASGIQLYFEDENFSKRNSQLRFENFTSKKKVKKALDSILRPTMYEEDIINLMQGSGATLEDVTQTDYGKFLRFVYKQTEEAFLRDIKSRTWATPNSFKIVFKFNQSNQFNELSVYGE